MYKLRVSQILSRLKTSTIALLFVGTQIVAPIAMGATASATEAANLDQWANLDSAWVNGNLGSSKASLREGDSVPYRMTLTGITTGSHSLTIEWDTTKSGTHALDYLTSYDKTFNADPCLGGISGCSFASPSKYAIPQDPNVPFAQVPGFIQLSGGTITSVSPYSLSGTYTGDSSTSITINFTTTSVTNPVFAWGGHIASQIDWGYGNSASAVSGSPYHTRLINIDGGGGNQDRSLSADSILPTPIMNTQVNSSSVFLGSSNYDVATVAKVNNGPVPQGTVAFYLCGPLGSATGCTTGGTLIGSPVTLNASGVATSATYTASALGYYCYRAEYVPSASSPYSPQNHTNTSTECFQVIPVPNGNLTLIKHVVNSNGGTLDASSFNMHIKSNGSDVTGSPFTGSEAGTTKSLPAGTYTVSEDTPPTGYTQQSIVCDGNPTASVTITSSSSHTCTITNVDVAPQLTVIKHVINDNGGTKTASDFTMNVTATSPSQASFAGSETPGTTITLKAGSYGVEETSHVGYSESKSADCSGSIAVGEHKTCTITNDDIAPTIKLVKAVVNNSGGNALPSQWLLSATPTVGSAISGQGGFDFTAAKAGVAYNLAEANGPAGYAPSSWVCTGGGTQNGSSVTLGLAESVTCTITNDDIAPTLTVTKVVVNNDGGTLIVSSFPLNVRGTLVVSGVTNSFSAGTYTVSETQQAGYTMTGITGDCAVDGSITLQLGGTYNCTITNNDIAPKLTLVKKVVNAGGGTETADAWTLSAQKPDSTYVIHKTGTPNIDGTQATTGPTDVRAAVIYTLSEDGPTGYSASGWTCTGTGGTQVGSTISLALAADVTCTITNTAIAPTLTLVKNVTNDNGGSRNANEWTLKAQNGTNTPLINATGTQDNNLNKATTQTVAAVAGVGYTLSENGPDGYNASDWSCTGGTLVGSTITLGLNQNVTCSITNNDIAPTLKLVKVVKNDFGGNASTTDWTLYATPSSGATLSGAGGFDFHTAAANTAYSLTESTGPTGYTPSAWSCDGGTINGNSVTLGLNENVTCTITNTAQAPSLTVVKQVVNDNGGTAKAVDFTLNVNDSALASPSITNNGDTATYIMPGPIANFAYTVSETPFAGYQQTSLVCTDNDSHATLTNPVTLNEGQHVTCVVTNNDKAPSLDVSKQVINDNGGTAFASDFTLRVNGNALSNPYKGGGDVLDNGVTYNYANAQANTAYTVTEDAFSGYAQIGSTVCTDNDTQSVVAQPVVLAPGQHVTCALTNSDTAPKLIVIKHVINDNSGSMQAKDFTMEVTGTNVSDASFPGAEAPGTTVTLNAGTYSVDEASHAGYTQTLSADCSGSIALNQTKTCTITNDDIPNPKIHVTKMSDKQYYYRGDTVNYTFAVTNPGDTALSNVTVTDALAGVSTPQYVTGDANNNNKLDVNETWIYTAEYTVPADTNATSILNKVTACGTDELHVQVCSDGYNCIHIYHPQIIVNKVVVTTNPNGDNGLFNLQIDGQTAGTGANVGDGGTTGLVEVLPGTYSVGETAGTKTDLTNYSATYSKDCAEGEVTVSGDETATCTITNTRLGTITIIKDAQPDSSQAFTFEGNLTGDNGPNFQLVDDGSNSGTQQRVFTNLPVDKTYTVTESNVKGWDLADIQCDTEEGVNVNNRNVEINLEAGQNITCTFINQKEATVIVTKFNDYNRNGYYDNEGNPAEPALPGWEINLGETTQTTGSDGTTTFSDLKANKWYTLGENMQDGWNQSNIYCDNQQVEDSFVAQTDSFLNDGGSELRTYPGAVIHCYIGNYQDLVLNITKSVNKPAPQPNLPGDIVTYSLVVTNPENSGVSFNTVVTDLPPSGFTYQTGTWTASSSDPSHDVSVDVYNGSLDDGGDGNPTYGSPGLWHIGTLMPGEIVTLTYQAKIGTNVSDGTYPDLAFVRGFVTPYEESASVLGNLSFSNTPFVHASVAVVSPQVLGSYTAPEVLVNTGTNLLWAQFLLPIALIGGAVGIRRATRAQERGGK